MLFVASCCSFWFLMRVSICRSVSFTVLRCFFLFLKWNQFYLKNQNRQMPFVACYGFLLLVLVFCGCFHLSIALLVVVFRWYGKPKRATKGKNVQMETRLNNKKILTVLRSKVLIFGFGGGGGQNLSIQKYL